jgi:lysosomal acid phosphatase
MHYERTKFVGRFHGKVSWPLYFWNILYFTPPQPPLEHNNPLPIAWQPVAIKVINREVDHLIAQKRPCPKYDETLARLYEKPPGDVKEMNAKATELYRILSKNTGENISTILDVELLYSTLDIESQNGLTLPDWTENIFPDKMLALVKRSYAL